MVEIRVEPGCRVRGLETEFQGSMNRLTIKHGTIIDGLRISIRGHRNHIVIGGKSNISSTSIEIAGMSECGFPDGNSNRDLNVESTSFSPLSCFPKVTAVAAQFAPEVL